MSSLNEFEANILMWIQDNLRTEVFDVIMPFLSHINDAGMLAIITAVVLVIWKRYRYAGITAVSSLSMEAVLVNVLLKRLIARTRPYIANEAIMVLGNIPADHSFPSGHTGSIFAVSTVMLMSMPRKYGVPAIVLSVLIGISRLYNAAHYPTDVLGGMAIGIFTGVVAYKLVYMRLLRRHENN